MDWNTYNLKGERAAVKDLVAKNDKLPEWVKAFVAAEIDALPESCTHVTVNGYGQSHAQPNGLVRNIQVTIAAVSF